MKNLGSFKASSKYVCYSTSNLSELFGILSGKHIRWILLFQLTYQLTLSLLQTHQ